MKRVLAFLAIVGFGIAALIVGERRKSGPVDSPVSILDWIAGVEREAVRVPAAATRLSDDEEIRIGDQIASQQFFVSAETGSDTERRKLQAYISKIGMQVGGRAHRKLPYRFHYVPDPAFINSFALPGGHVFIGKGLIALMDSEDELAFVLGHEVEHIDHYHCVERVQVESRLRTIPLGGLVNLPIGIFMAGYSKDQELEADREGARLAVRAGYSPLGAIRMFETFDRLYHEVQQPAANPQQEISDVARQTLEGYFRSHPLPAERIAQVRRLMADEHWENLVAERPLEVAALLRTARK